MKIISRYLTREVLAGVGLALLVVVGLDALMAFIAELKDIGQGRYDLWQALQFVVMTLPRRTQEALPVAILLGGLMGLGRLASGSELVVLRAAGISHGQLIMALMKMGLVLMLVSWLWGEFVVPPTEQFARSERSLAQSNGALLQSRYGIWARDGASFVHIRDLASGGELGDVDIYEFDGQGRLVLASHATRAVPDDEFWTLEGLARSRISETGVQTQQIQSERWASLLSPDLLNVVLTEPSYLSARDLFQYIRYLHGNGLDARIYELAFWNRVISPLNILVMLVFVVPFVLGPLRNSGTGQRVMLGILLGVVFYLLNRTYYQLGQVYDLSPILSSVFPGLLFLAIGLYALKRTP